MAPKVAKLPESEVMIPMRIGSGAARAPGAARKTQRTRRRRPWRTRMISPGKGSARAKTPTPRTPFATLGWNGEAGGVGSHERRQGAAPSMIAVALAGGRSGDLVLWGRA